MFLARLFTPPLPCLPGLPACVCPPSPLLPFPCRPPLPTGGRMRRRILGALLCGCVRALQKARRNSHLVYLPHTNTCLGCLRILYSISPVAERALFSINTTKDGKKNFFVAEKTKKKKG
ncbi:hypothetical protein B0T25DRAFT_22073 [Lasiosphaeria hispida]|uniref:Uncharacterized protein n=1 Tax=Lasiosphaeria hispida TaxID=260671 RepID=A0AAJ0HUF3_9PEZI|nr:hypothetical protein B0T25DRAFT_22073 [Lasiosphaeria hispida]